VTREEDWIGQPGYGRLLRRYPGAEPVMVRGSLIRITQVDVYESGAKIDWLLSPLPEFGDVEPDQLLVQTAADRSDVSLEHREEYLTVTRQLARERSFLGFPTVADEVGQRYRVTSEGHGSVAGGLDGQIWIRPQPGRGRTLRIVIAGVQLSVPLAE
jgi:hypothetical protein